SWTRASVKQAPWPKTPGLSTRRTRVGRSRCLYIPGT
ncbi:hypothetical protein AK812_SmicGene48191, partial [Symbiodinium microadriaticum]